MRGVRDEICGQCSDDIGDGSGEQFVLQKVFECGCFCVSADLERSDGRGRGLRVDC